MGASGSSLATRGALSREQFPSRSDRRRMSSEISNGLACFGARPGARSRFARGLRGVYIAALPLADRALSAIPQTVGGCVRARPGWIQSAARRHREKTNDMTLVVCSVVRRSLRSLLMIDSQLTTLTLVFTARAARAKKRSHLRGRLQGNFRDGGRVGDGRVGDGGRVRTGGCDSNGGRSGVTHVSRNEGEAVSMSGRRQARAPGRAGASQPCAGDVGP